jgi:Tfp pilus assembly protein PilF
VALAQERLQVNPNDTDVPIMLAYYYAMLGERSQALASLQQAFQARPRDAEMSFWGAVIYNQFGERERALEQLEQAITRGWSMAELRTAVELDNLRDDRRVRDLIGSP